jgi:hypothetical protein
MAWCAGLENRGLSPVIFETLFLTLLSGLDNEVP